MKGLSDFVLFLSIAYASSQDCGGALKGPNGTLTSPNYPSNYPDNYQCSWSITVGEGNIIELVFLDFELENASPIRGCVGHDYVTVIDHKLTYGPYCGSVAPPRIISKTNILEVTFRSDESLNYRGFKASYREIPAITTTPVPTTRYPPNLNCGSELVGDSGFLTSPKYPENYPDNADCAFFIELEANSTGSITLKFLDFEVESSENCKADSLKVHDGENGYAPVVANLCGKKAIQPIVTSGKRVYLHFTTDAANNARGFNISWERSTCAEVGGVCAEKCQHGELDGQQDTCRNPTLRCCKPAPEPVCGKRVTGNDDLPYISGGGEAQPNSWPWMLSLQGDNLGHFCGAVLLSDEWAVTSAQCVQSDLTFTVVAGEHDMLSVSGNEVRIDTSRIIMHEDFIIGRPFPNDIALLKLSKKLPLGPKIFPACFPERDMEFGPDDDCYITGWGLTGYKDVDSPILKELAISPRDQEVCKDYWPRYILTNNICVGNGLSVGCDGDTGGPLVCKKDNKWFVAGVHSWGTRRCATGNAPSVYTQVAKYKTWVDEKIKANGGY